MRVHPSFIAAIGMSALLGMAACRSHQIDAVVENRTGARIELLEVDYPSASFGINVLDAGADYRYRLKVVGTGSVKVQYTESAGQKLRQLTGPSLYEHQEGRLEIVLLPEGKAEFHPELTPHS